MGTSAKRFRVQEVDPSGRRYSWGRTADLDEHIAILKNELEGRPVICLEHAGLVVRIRRKVDLQPSLAAFFDLWDREAEQLAANLPSRWLISACDTFADYGTSFQRAAALILSATVNTLKLAETERLLLRDASHDRAKTDALIRTHDERVHVELWDGMTAYSVVAGDMPRNLFARISRVLAEDPALSAIGAALIDRAIEGDTVFGRLAQLNPRFAPPSEPST